MSRKLQVLIATVAAGLVLGAAPAEATFPGSNGRVAFASPSDGDYDVYTMNADGTGLVNVTNNGAYDVEPALAPGGGLSLSLAYASNVDGGALEIYVKPALGAAKRLTFDPGEDTDPAWSPDGSQIAFASNRDGDYDIYTVSAAGGAPTKQTSNTTDDRHPAWAPDGKRIGYVGNDGDDEIYFKVLGTSLPPAKLTDNAATDRRPSWSPDGQRFVFASDRDGNFEIYRMQKDGTDEIRLTDDPAFDSQPAWSPDGKSIVFASERLGASQLFTMDGSGNDEQAVGGDPASSETPDWGRAVVLIPDPTLSMQTVKNVKVHPRGTYADVTFQQTIATKKTRVELWKPKKKAGAFVRLQTLKSGEPRKSWSVKVTHLEPGTTYELRVVAGGPKGDVEYVHPTRVETLRRTVTLKVEEIRVLDDGDWDNCGEFTFDFLLGDTLGRVFNDDICDGETWEPGHVQVTAPNVKSDQLTLRILGVDCDLDNLYGDLCGFNHATYGSPKSSGDWTEVTVMLDVGAKKFTLLGENYTLVGKVKTKGNVSPKLTYHIRVTVLHL